MAATDQATAIRVDIEETVFEPSVGGHVEDRGGLEGPGGWPLFIERFGDLTAAWRDSGLGRAALGALA